MSPSAPVRDFRLDMPLRVWFASSEVVPFAKTGGLADVAGALPKALRRRGVDVRVVMPLYGRPDGRDLELLDGILRVPMYHGEARAAVHLGRLPGDVPVYLVEHQGYFDRPHLYGDGGGPYSDNLERFAFFSRATIELAKALAFTPDVVHANDWQTALVPVYLDALEREGALAGAACVFTVHNLAYQGDFDLDAGFLTGLGPERTRSGALEHFGRMNLLKGAIRHATLLSTVSPTYAREIQSPQHGFGLDGVLASRAGDLRGILNGIDADVWDPLDDRLLDAHFGPDDLAGKAVCKARLQQQVGLPVRAGVPVFGAIGRLTHQKGFDYLAAALERVLQWDLQIVLLGTGDPGLESAFAARSAAPNGSKFRARIGFDDAFAHRIEAGSDFFLMPSRFEPCGLNQMYSLCYGALPIVHATGGLADTVQNYDQATGGGTGFVVHDLTVDSLVDTIGWALSTYYDRPAHVEAMRRRGMETDFSWDRVAGEYEDLYREAARRHALARGAGHR